MKIKKVLISLGVAVLACSSVGLMAFNAFNEVRAEIDSSVVEEVGLKDKDQKQALNDLRHMFANDASVVEEVGLKDKKQKQALDDLSNDAVKRDMPFNEWLSNIVLLNKDHMFSKDFVLGRAKALGQYDFFVLVASGVIPDKLDSDIVYKDGTRPGGGVLFSDSALKGKKEVKMVVRTIYTDTDQERKRVLQKDLKAVQGGFKFSLNENELELGKCYDIEFWDINEEPYEALTPKIDIRMQEGGKTYLGKVRLYLPSKEEFAVNGFALGQLRSFGVKERAKG